MVAAQGRSTNAAPFTLSETALADKQVATAGTLFAAVVYRGYSGRDDRMNRDFRRLNSGASAHLRYIRRIDR
jgi:hypothetical protein